MIIKDLNREQGNLDGKSGLKRKQDITVKKGQNASPLHRIFLKVKIENV